MTTGAVARPLLLAAGATALDGLAAAGYGCWQLVAIAVRPRGTALGVAALGGLLFLVFGAGLLLVAHVLRLGRRRGRAPAAVAHLVALALVPGLVEGGSWWVALPLGLFAIAAGIGLFAPSSTRTLQAQR